MTGAGLGVPSGGTPPSFTGAGDVVSGAKAWWGLRAYTAATRGNKLINACNSTGGVDVGCADMFSDATTGKLVPATISGIPCPGANCTIKQFYDLSGLTSCGGFPCDELQNTVANRATLDANCIGTQPCANFTAASSQQYSDPSGNGIGTAQPYWVSYVAERKSGTAQGDIIGAGGSFSIVGFNGAANKVEMFAGSSVTASASDAALHAVQNLFNGASSSIYVDGVLTGSLNPGTNAFGNGSTAILLGNNGFGNFMNGFFLEGGMWAGDQSASNSAMNANQHGTSGWNF